MLKYQLKSLNELPTDAIPKEIENSFVYVDQEENQINKVGYDIDREVDCNELLNDENTCFSFSLLSNTAESISHDLNEKINLLKRAYLKIN